MSPGFCIGLIINMKGHEWCVAADGRWPYEEIEKPRIVASRTYVHYLKLYTRHPYVL